MIRFRSIPHVLIAILVAGSLGPAHANGTEWSVESRERRSTRWWTWDYGTNKPAQIAIQYDRVTFAPNEDPLDELDGRYTPPGGWITLDAFRPLTSGKQTIAPGRYFVALEKHGGTAQLILMDSEAILQRRLGTENLAEAPVARALDAELRTPAEYAEELFVEMTARKNTSFELNIALGGWSVHVPFEVGLEEADWSGSLTDRLRISGGVTDRVCRRAVATDGGAIVGRVQLSYNPVVWKQAIGRESREATEMVGRSWRLGRNFWTVLTTDVPLRFGDAELDAGVWYVGVHYSRDGESWQLEFYDPARVHDLHLDSNWASVAPAAMRVSGDRSLDEEVVDELELKLLPDATGLRLQIAYGPHRFGRSFVPVTDLLPESYDHWALMWRASDCLRRGYLDQAILLYDEIAEHEPDRAATAFYNIACARSKMGQIDRALESLRVAFQHGFQNRAHMSIDPDLAAIRNDPRFEELMAPGG